MPDFDVVDLDPADHPSVGDAAPDFTRPLVTDEFWENRSLAGVVADAQADPDATGDADETPTVLVFTSMVGSFLAEYVLTELRDRGVDDRATVVGVSISTPYEIRAFQDRVDVPFPLFSDPGNDVATAYDLVHDLDGMAGVEEPRPAVFVLDADRTIRHAWVAEEWPDFPDYDALEAVL